jgi:putative resolvase
MAEKDEGKMLTISEAARRLGVHAKTLRSWADKGLVPPVRLPSGYRRWTPEQVEETRRTMMRA